MIIGTVILCNVINKMVKKYFQNLNYLCDDVTNYVTNYEKKAKNCKNLGFLKITIVAVSEEIFLIFFHYLEVNRTYKLKILWSIC